MHHSTSFESPASQQDSTSYPEACRNQHEASTIASWSGLAGTPQQGCAAVIIVPQQQRLRAA